MRANPLRRSGTTKLDSRLFVTHRPPHADVVPLDLVHSVFGEFLDDTHNVDVDDSDHQLVDSLQRTMASYWSNELEQFHTFRSILTDHYKEILLSATQVGATKRTTDGHIEVDGFLITVLEGKRVGGEAELQGSMYSTHPPLTLQPQSNRMNMATQDPKDDLNECQAFCRVLSVRRHRRRRNRPGRGRQVALQLLLL